MLGAAFPHDRPDAGRFLARGASGGGPAGLAQLGVIVDRLGEVIDEETDQLRRHTAVDLKDFNDRKSQGLLELTRALREVGKAAMHDAALQERLDGLRHRLELNQRALKLHLEAVREVSTIVADAIRDADSDGTYTPSIRSGSQNPWSD